MQLVDNANKLYPLSKLIKIVQVLVPTTRVLPIVIIVIDSIDSYSSNSNTCSNFLFVEVSLGHQNMMWIIEENAGLIGIICGWLIWVELAAKFDMLLPPFKKIIEEETQRR